MFPGTRLEIIEYLDSKNYQYIGNMFDDFFIRKDLLGVKYNIDLEAAQKSFPLFSPNLEQDRHHLMGIHVAIWGDKSNPSGRECLYRNYCDENVFQIKKWWEIWFDTKNVQIFVQKVSYICKNLTIFMCNFIFLSSKNFIKYWMKDLPPKIARFKLISIESILYSLWQKFAGGDKMTILDWDLDNKKLCWLGKKETY